MERACAPISIRLSTAFSDPCRHRTTSAADRTALHFLANGALHLSRNAPATIRLPIRLGSLKKKCGTTIGFGNRSTLAGGKLPPCGRGILSIAKRTVTVFETVFRQNRIPRRLFECDHSRWHRIQAAFARDRSKKRGAARVYSREKIGRLQTVRTNTECRCSAPSARTPRAGDPRADRQTDPFERAMGTGIGGSRPFGRMECRKRTAHAAVAGIQRQQPDPCRDRGISERRKIRSFHQIFNGNAGKLFPHVDIGHIRNRTGSNFGYIF